MVSCLVSRSKCDEDIAKELTNRFNDDSTECVDTQNDTQPIYKCSGIIIRGFKSYSNDTKFVWSLKPADREKNSFSFGFLRKDHPFSRLGKGYDAGFILYPHLSTPQQKNTQKVLCGFPIDARTDMRYERGCGLRRNDTTEISRPCDAQNVTTYEQWLLHYNTIMSSESTSFEIRQCGFDLMTKETAVRNFGIFLEANIHLQTNSRFAFINSELRLEGWDDNNPKQIPIQAFFYFIDSAEGYANALKYQEDFYTQTGGEKVPVVGIRLPSASNPNIVVKEYVKKFK